MEEGKLFHIGTVMSVMSGMGLRGLDDLKEILVYMTGDSTLWIIQYLRVCEECIPYLIRQRPQLGHYKIRGWIRGLQEAYEALQDKSQKQALFDEWVQKLIDGEGFDAQYPEQLEVNKIPVFAHRVINPLK